MLGQIPWLRIRLLKNIRNKAFQCAGLSLVIIMHNQDDTLPELNLESQLSKKSTDLFVSAESCTPELSALALKHQSTILSNLSSDEDEQISLPKPGSILSQAPNPVPVQQQDQRCQLHQKPFQIICVTDKCKICTSCAIFGGHKNHLFKSEEDIRRDKYTYLNEINQIINRKCIINQDQKSGKYVETVKAKKEQITKAVQRKFDRIRKTIEEAQLSVKRSIEKTMKQIQQSQLKLVKGAHDAFNSQFSLWQQSAIKQIEVLSSDDVMSHLEVLDYNKNRQQFRVQDANRLLEEYSEKIQAGARGLQQQVDQVVLEIDDTIQSKISKCVRVVKKLELELPPVPSLQNYVSNGEEKLIDEQPNEIKEEPHQSEKSGSDKLHNTSISSISQPKFSQSFYMINSQLLKIDLSFRSDKPKGKMQQKPISETRVLTRKPAKSTGKMALPQKYQKMYESLVADKLETLDLTNAELGDSACEYIVKHLPNSKCKTLKLIRNKVTDEGLIAMFGYFQNLVTLNLSQNLLTDSSVQYILCNLERLPNLKSLALSLNKIKERSVRDKLQSIKKHGIVVSI